MNLSDAIANGSLGPELSNEIFGRVSERSVIARAAKRTDMAISGNTFLIDVGRAEASIVEEGQPKPVSNSALGFVKAVPIKAAVISTWTKEFRLANPAAALQRVQDKLVEAINDQIDYAVLYGKDVRLDTDIAGLTPLNDTTNRVTLGTASAAEGGLYTDMLSGYDLVTDAGAYDFTSFVADPRMRSTLAGAVDVNGRPIYSNGTNLGATSGDLFGLPVEYGRVVSGRAGNGKPDTGVRAFGGDFAGAMRFGFVDDISIKLSDSATVDGVSLWETNQEAALCEAIFSFVIVDHDAFVAYEAAADPAGDPDPEPEG